MFKQAIQGNEDDPKNAVVLSAIAASDPNVSKRFRGS
jgi:hypothetical protein